MIIVSACLIGVNCRYNGASEKVAEIEQMVAAGKAIPLCPEVLGGLPIPRAPCEIVIDENGKKRVKTKDGKDFTAHFEKGAEKTLKIAKILEADAAILKARSPSCGYGQIYDGTFNGKLKEGNGLTAELLSQNNIKIYNEDNYER